MFTRHHSSGILGGESMKSVGFSCRDLRSISGFGFGDASAHVGSKIL
jgi:hypothetical protein